MHYYTIPCIVTSVMEKQMSEDENYSQKVQ